MKFIGKAERLAEKQVDLPVDGVVLHGDWVVPRGAEGIVLFAHGSGSSRKSPRNREVARVIHEVGLGTLLFDLLTPEEEFSERETRHLRFDIRFLARRLRAATAWVLRQPETARMRLGYFGSSTGGAAALVAAANEPDHVQAVVSRGGRPDLAGAALPAVVAPTLLIVGGRDQDVLRLNQEALAELTCKKELQVIPGASHLFEEEGALEKVAKAAAVWFGCHLRQPSR